MLHTDSTSLDKHRALPDRHAGFDLLQIPMAEVKSLRAVLRAHFDDDARLFSSDEAEAMLDEDAMRSVLALATHDEVAQHLFCHRQIGAVIDAGNLFPIFHATHDAEKLRLRAFTRLEDSHGGLDGIFVEDEYGRHGVRINGQMADGA